MTAVRSEERWRNGSRRAQANDSWSPFTTGRDALDVSLHDDELCDEVEWTARLMIAANESEGRLASESIDEILGVVAWSR
ncbi:MAG: hypothetical protein ACXVWX_05990 [Nocardioides sp.]